MTPFERHTCSSISNLTSNASQYNTRAQNDTIETDDVQLETNEQNESRTRKGKQDTFGQKSKTEVTAKQMYGKTLPSLTRNPNIDSKNRPQNTSNIRNCHGVAQVIATATVTVNLPVELKQGRTAQESCSNTAIVPRYSTQKSDMEVVDIEDEFV